GAVVRRVLLFAGLTPDPRRSVAGAPDGWTSYEAQQSFPFPSSIRTAMRLFLFAALALPLTAVAQVPPAGRLDSIFAPYQGTDRPGCAVAVSRNGELIVARGYGMADHSQGTIITPQSIFHIASVSKQFTAMTLVLLAA